MYTSFPLSDDIEAGKETPLVKYERTYEETSNSSMLDKTHKGPGFS